MTDKYKEALEQLHSEFKVAIATIIDPPEVCDEEFVIEYVKEINDVWQQTFKALDGVVKKALEAK